jgi:hypothetical protein
LVLTHSIQFKPLEKFWLSRLCLDDKRKWEERKWKEWLLKERK